MGTKRFQRESVAEILLTLNDLSASVKRDVKKIKRSQKRVGKALKDIRSNIFVRDNKG